MRHRRRGRSEEHEHGIAWHSMAELETETERIKRVRVFAPPMMAFPEVEFALGWIFLFISYLASPSWPWSLVINLVGGRLSDRIVSYPTASSSLDWSPR